MDDATQGLTALLGWSTDFNGSAYNLAGSIAAALLGVALIFVVWEMCIRDRPKSSSIFSFHMKNTMPTTISRHWSHARSGDCPKKTFISYMSYPSISTSWPEYIW